jgi:hypothetical protein
VADDIVERLREHEDIAARVADAGWRMRVGASGPEVALNIFRDAADVVQAQQAEIKQLSRWKAEAIEVLNRWDAVADMVPICLGDRKSDAVAAEIERLRAERAVTDRPFQVQPGDRTLSFGYGPDGVTIDFDADGRAFRVIVNGVRFVKESRD